MSITLEQAHRIVESASTHARSINAAPLTIAIVDAGGHLKTLSRQDDASALRPEVATAKARTAINLGKSSRKVAEDAAQRPAFVGSLSSLAAGNIIPAAGGFRILDEQGRVVGAVGITGDTSDRDEECAVAGVQAAGLVAEL